MKSMKISLFWLATICKRIYIPIISVSVPFLSFKMGFEFRCVHERDARARGEIIEWEVNVFKYVFKEKRNLMI